MVKLKLYNLLKGKILKSDKIKMKMQGSSAECVRGERYQREMIFCFPIHHLSCSACKTDT